jgi:hypothetical protein
MTRFEGDPEGSKRNGLTFSVWTESINSGNKSFTSKLSTFSGPKDSSTNPLIEMKEEHYFNGWRYL